MRRMRCAMMNVSSSSIEAIFTERPSKAAGVTRLFRGRSGRSHSRPQRQAQSIW